MGNRHELLSIFLTENELFPENVQNRVRGNEPNGRTSQPTNLILISIEAKFSALQNYREFFFDFHFSFRVSHEFSEKCIFA